MQLKIKYLTSNVDHIKKLPQGDWLDLRCAKETVMLEGEYLLISLGVAIQLPAGFEAHLVPRSSTFKKYGIIQTNSPGIIDESYSGNNDEWKFSAYAIRNTLIPLNERICQFRIVKKQPDFDIVEVDNLESVDRGGFGSSGYK